MESHFTEVQMQLLLHNDKRSIDHVESWIKEFKRQTNTEAIIMIVGNKTNLPRKVKFSSELKIAKKHNILFFECTAKEFNSVLPMFVKLTTAVRNKNVLGDVKIKDGRILQIRTEFRHIALQTRTNRNFCDIFIHSVVSKY
jgi:GTPase SAR1 family protein